MGGNSEETVITVDDAEDQAATSAVSETAIIDEAPAAVVDEDADIGGDFPARAVRNADGTVTLPLRFPVSLQIRSANGTVRTAANAELKLHRLNGADLMAISAASNAAKPVVLLARAAKMREPIARALVERMDGADMLDVTKVIDGFFGSGPTTGR